jgi:hypothetical protein
MITHTPPLPGGRLLWYSIRVISLPRPLSRIVNTRGRHQGQRSMYGNCRRTRPSGHVLIAPKDPSIASFIGIWYHSSTEEAVDKTTSLGTSVWLFAQPRAMTWPDKSINGGWPRPAT